MKAKAILLSVRPQYAEKIFDGTKRIELRRTRPNFSEGDTVFVYVSAPVKEIRGTFKVEKLIQHPPEKLWTFVRHDAGISKQEFDEYYNGAEWGCGICLRAPMIIQRPISLDRLRKLWLGFRPPQSYKYLTASEIDKVKAAL